MKILVVSDSHENLEKLIEIFDFENPQIVICAGDCALDFEELSYVKENAHYYIVRGNCDIYNDSFLDVLSFSIKNYNFFLTHGHVQNVKKNLFLLKKEAEETKADIVIFGHTHLQHYDKTNNIFYFNPGFAKIGEYGIIEIDENNIVFKHNKI